MTVYGLAKYLSLGIKSVCDGAHKLVAYISIFGLVNFTHARRARDINLCQIVADHIFYPRQEFQVNTFGP